MQSLKQLATQWLRKAKIILLVLAITISSLSYATISVTSNALTQAYEFQLEAIKTQIKYETLQESYDMRIKQLEQENSRQWWFTIAMAVALGYAAGK